MPTAQREVQNPYTDASERALKAAKELVAYIEFFRTHGTGDCMRRYPDDESMGGYDNIVRRAAELADAVRGFDPSYDRRHPIPVVTLEDLEDIDLLQGRSVAEYLGRV